MYEHLEFSEDKTARLIAKGQWRYDSLIPKPVRIYALNFDFYFDLDEGYHDEGTQPELNGEGEQYVVVWHDDPFFEARDFPSNGYMTFAEAAQYASSVVGEIKWEDAV